MKKFKLNNRTVILASHNTGKIAEFEALFLKYNVNIQTISTLGIEDIDETGKTFEENAVIKVKTVPDGSIGLSDDSGLSIKSLNHAPGIYSARYAKKLGGWSKAMKELYFEAKKKNGFSATFHCVLALKSENSEISIFKGEVNGKIVWPPRGENGFGYDPFFIPRNSKKTFGEMFHKKKILQDHRFEAFKKMAKFHLTDS